MKIIKQLYLKYFFSLIICLLSSFIIFFIFSLLGNLSESYYFKTIINLSFLNSLQIISYVPAFIFLITVILFIIFLKSKNEITIIKSYMSIKKLSLFFIPIVIIFTVLEISKRNITDFFENSKSDLLDKQNTILTKILVNENLKSKTYTVIKNISNEDFENTEYRSYIIFDKTIQLAEFSNNLIRFNNTIVADNYTQYKNNLIKDIYDQKLIDINLQDLNEQNLTVKYINEKKDLIYSIEFINIFIFYLLFFSYIFLIFLNRKFINPKESLMYPIIICVILLLYSFFIFNNSLSIYKQEYEFLASIIVGILLFKESLYE